MEPDRQAVISQLADLICAVECSHPLRVAIDGVDAAGKTMLADELVVPLQTMGRVVIRASVDGFHNPRTVRYQRGADSPEGYYRDSFNHGAILRAVLNPLGPDGNRKIRRTGFDFRADEPTNQLRIEVPEVAILLFDGVFLWHPTLKSYWDFLIFVEVDFNISIARAVARKPRIIIFDEATNALDSDTEDMIMQTIYNIKKDITIFIVAHRVTTLKKCNKIIKLEEGKVRVVRQL